jgi:hypothetical protein
MHVSNPRKASFLHRHELDLLEKRDEIDASPAKPWELPTMVALARDAVPGVSIKSTTVAGIYAQNPICIFPFRSGGRIVGGIAFLYLNDVGLDRLLLDELDFSEPDPALLAAAGEAPAAIYVWALAARGRGAFGIANVSLRLRREPFAHADYYAQPSTEEGERLLGQLGFERTHSFQHSLWIYRRLCNRVPAQPQAALGCVA